MILHFIHRVALPIYSCLLLVAIGCSRDAGNEAFNSNQGTLAITAAIQSLASIAGTSIDCSTYQIGVMTVEIWRSGQQILSSDFSCETHFAEISSLPNGPGYEVRVTGRPTIGGPALWAGTAPGVTIAPQATTPVQVDVSVQVVSVQAEWAPSAGVGGFLLPSKLIVNGQTGIIGNVNPATIEFISSDPKIAVVDVGGIVKAISPGNASIIARYAGIASVPYAITVQSNGIPSQPAIFKSDTTSYWVAAGKTLSISVVTFLLDNNSAGALTLSNPCPSDPKWVCTFPGSVVPGTSGTVFTLGIQVAADVTPGTYLLDVKGSGVNNTADLTLSITIIPPAGMLSSSSTNDFSLSATPEQLLVPVGTTRVVSTNILATITNGTPATVNLSLSGCPTASGMTCTLSSAQVTPGSGSVGITVTIPGQARFGTVQFTVTGMAGTTLKSTTITLRQTSGVYRVSIANDGSEASGFICCVDNSGGSISSDGRYVAFLSTAANLLGQGNDTNNASDIFIRDTCRGVANCQPGTRRASVTTNGTQADSGVSGSPIISSNGRYVAFTSSATNLLGSGIDTNAASDVFVRDTCAGVTGCTPKTTRVSLDTNGSQLPGAVGSNLSSMTPDGRYIAFHYSGEIRVRDTVSQTTFTASLNSDGSIALGSACSSSVSISSNGQYIAWGHPLPVMWVDRIGNLGVADTNNVTDVYLRDRTLGKTVLASLTNNSVQSTGSSGLQCFAGALFPWVSDDGQSVAFKTDAPDIIGVGSDTNNITDVFLRYPAGISPSVPSTIRLSLANDGSQAIGGSGVYSYSITPDKRYLVFDSTSTNLIGAGMDTNSNSDVFLRDTCLLTPNCAPFTVRISVGSDGVQANGSSALDPFGRRSITPDGKIVVFGSSASNLIQGDSNGKWDIFVFDRMP